MVQATPCVCVYVYYIYIYIHTCTHTMQVQTYSMDGTFLIKILAVIAKAHQLKLLYEYFKNNVGACHILSQIRSSLYYSIFFISYFRPSNIG